ncbi:MAG: hypothetical protein J0L75_11925 [Spirochaetes bacterium]|nr:hypothetical protein [Spirochaetota bacterium]
MKNARFTPRRLVAALVLCTGMMSPLLADPWRAPAESYFTYIERHWWDFGFYVGPGLWSSGAENVGLSGMQGGLTARKRVGAGRVGSIIDLGFMRYETGVTNLSHLSVSSGTGSLFLPTMFTWSLFVNAGRYTRQMGAVAPLFGLGVAMLNHSAYTTTNEVRNGAAAFGHLGLELVGLPPTIAFRIGLRLGAEALGTAGQEPFSAMAAGLSKPLFFFCFTAGLVLYLG